MVVESGLQVVEAGLLGKLCWWLDGFETMSSDHWSLSLRCDAGGL